MLYVEVIIYGGPTTVNHATQHLGGKAILKSRFVTPNLSHKKTCNFSINLNVHNVLCDLVIICKCPMHDVYVHENAYRGVHSIIRGHCMRVVFETYGMHDSKDILLCKATLDFSFF